MGENGNALKHASEALKGDWEVVLAAVAQNSGAMRHASRQLQRDWHAASAPKHMPAVLGPGNGCSEGSPLASPAARDDGESDMSPAAVGPIGGGGKVAAIKAGGGAAEQKAAGDTDEQRMGGRRKRERVQMEQATGAAASAPVGAEAGGGDSKRARLSRSRTRDRLEGGGRKSRPGSSEAACTGPHPARLPEAAVCSLQGPSAAQEPTQQARAAQLREEER